MPVPTLLQIGMGVESSSFSLASQPEQARLHQYDILLLLTSFSLCSEEIVGAFAASRCCQSEGLKIDMSTSAPCSQDVENKPAPKSGTEAVSAQHCAGCNWPVETQI